jgi:hypothetical protein
MQAGRQAMESIDILTTGRVKRVSRVVKAKEG